MSVSVFTLTAGCNSRGSLFSLWVYQHIQILACLWAVWRRLLMLDWFYSVFHEPQLCVVAVFSSLQRLQALPVVHRSWRHHLLLAVGLAHPQVWVSSCASCAWLLYVVIDLFHSVVTSVGVHWSLCLNLGDKFNFLFSPLNEMKWNKMRFN